MVGRYPAYVCIAALTDNRVNTSTSYTFGQTVKQLLAKRPFDQHFRPFVGNTHSLLVNRACGVFNCCTSGHPLRVASPAFRAGLLCATLVFTMSKDSNTIFHFGLQSIARAICRFFQTPEQLSAGAERWARVCGLETGRVNLRPTLVASFEFQRAA